MSVFNHSWPYQSKSHLFSSPTPPDNTCKHGTSPHPPLLIQLEMIWQHWDGSLVDYASRIDRRCGVWMVRGVHRIIFGSWLSFFERVRVSEVRDNAISSRKSTRLQTCFEQVSRSQQPPNHFQPKWKIIRRQSWCSCPCHPYWLLIVYS